MNVGRAAASRIQTALQKKMEIYMGRRTVIDKKLIDQVQDLKENKRYLSLKWQNNG
jgi:hypothetical protein